MKITINITQKDLELFENDILCIPLCNEHKKDLHITHAPIDCKECKKVKEEWRNSVAKIFWKCWRAYWNEYDEKCKKV